MRISRRTKDLPCAASVDFLFVRRECSLAGTIFSSEFVVVQPDTGYFLRRNTALPAEFPRAKPYTEALSTLVASVYKLRMRLNNLHAALL
jgi:hypothetical protein